jgi:menaquinone-dependent protoporphyrinogen oxidase
MTTTTWIIKLPGADATRRVEGENPAPQKIMVTYASRFGYTAGVAEAIGKTLAKRGAQVDVLPMREVKDLSPYQAIIASSAINGGAWLPEAMRFVQAHRAVLVQKPFTVFQVCMTLAMRNAD